MRRFWLGGNWKMHGNMAQAHALSTCARKLAQTELPVQVVIFPAFPYLQLAAQCLQGSKAMCGAQDLAYQPPGAFTGAVSGEMILDVGCQYVLIGHSERRHVFQESHELLTRKFARAVELGLRPVLCVGETLSQREAGQSEHVVHAQLAAVLDVFGPAALRGAVLAYEPVWAIGTGKVATPEQAQAIHAHLRSIVRNHDANLASSLPIVYGGSVKASNASSLFAQPDIDGALIGGSSLDTLEFTAIVEGAKDLAG